MGKLRLTLFLICTVITVIHCVSKSIPNIFDCNLKTNYQFSPYFLI